MKPSQTIFNKDTLTVTISLHVYNQLVRDSNLLQDYKQIASEMKAILPTTRLQTNRFRNESNTQRR